MVTKGAAAGSSPLLMSCNDHHSHFSFTSCPHSSSHGFVCTTTTDSNENQDHGKHLVYPSPPPTTSQPKRNVPLPHQFGGILDSPVVFMCAPAPTLLSPPPTIPTPTHALPPADISDAPFSSLLQPIAEHEHESPRPSQPQLLSPISPEWTTNRKPEDELFNSGDRADCVLMSQPPQGAYDYPFGPNADEDDVLGNAASFGRPALRPLDIPMYHDQDTMHADPAAQGVLLGFPGMMPHIEEDKDAPSPFEFSPPSSASSFRDSQSSDSDLDDLDLDMDIPSSYASPSLRSFTSLPSPDLDDLDLDMDLGPGSMWPLSPSPSRHSVTSLPSFDESEYDLCFAPDQTDTPAVDVSMSPPPSLPVILATPHSNALLLDLPVLPPAGPKTSILDSMTPDALAELLPEGYSRAELDALLDVRRRAGIALAALQSSTAAPAPSHGLDHELRRSVPRDSGEPRRRRKRAKELGREVDALVGLALGLLPASVATSPGEAESEAERAKARAKGDKAGLAGLASVPQLVARMILRRRERCVRGLAEGGGRAREAHVPSPLRSCFGVEGDEPPPPMDVDVDAESVCA
ncbi:hypothetical protein DFH07DRAFT_316833 [Mycena maculata]|uniref:Uncharacterized protein n=1 Tax=Mycena maculata TaxID=230809 RepID=A0AAD7HES9_9AGAR|nr:hypothetical protein DFH07DRAFT_316833 [Mycena maculata]